VEFETVGVTLATGLLLGDAMTDADAEEVLEDDPLVDLAMAAQVEYLEDFAWPRSISKLPKPAAWYVKAVEAEAGVVGLVLLRAQPRKYVSSVASNVAGCPRMQPLQRKV
jgi:hypothetical protein